MKTSKRDFIIIGVISFLAIIIYITVVIIDRNKESSQAAVFYSYTENVAIKRQKVVVVDFDKKEVIVLEKQANVPKNLGEYPIIDEEKCTITLLGNYEENDKRTILVIEYNFEKRSMEIVDETSPKNICSKMGVSTSKPLICLPNGIRVEFTQKESVDIDGSV